MVPINPYIMAMCRESQDVNPLFNHIGARLCSAEDGTASITLPIRPYLTQGEGAIAGGILATLADESMAHAVISLLDHACQHTVTAEMNIRFLRGADPDKGGTLIATARVVKPGRRLMVAEAEVRHDSGRLLVTAGGSFFVIDAPHPGQ